MSDAKASCILFQYNVVLIEHKTYFCIADAPFWFLVPHMQTKTEVEAYKRKDRHWHRYCLQYVSVLVGQAISKRTIAASIR